MDCEVVYVLRGLYTAAFGMKQNQVRQDVAANNIANSETTGYKGDAVVARPFPEVMLQNMDDNGLGEPKVQKLGPLPLGVETEGPYTDFSQGVSVETGRDLDFYIEGRGFFPIRYFDGISESIKYTRDGSFSLDSDGNVVTSEGGHLLVRDAETGQTVPMKLDGDEITIDGNGNILVDNVKKYSFIINDFDDYSNIEKYGKNMYSIRDGSGAAVFDADGSRVVQGSLEQSNVDMTSEITNMISNFRNYQANQRVLKAIDETLDKTVNQVGSVK